MPGLQMKYFVLKPAGDSINAKASRDALYTYAETIAPVYPELAFDIINWVKREEAAAGE